MTAHRPFCTCWPGATVWLTGPAGADADRTTVARALARRLETEGRRVHVFDGDETVALFGPGTGRASQHRVADVRRVGLVAEVLARNGVLALVPLTAPDTRDMAAVRERHARTETTCLEVQVTTGRAGRAGPGADNDPHAPPDLTLPAHRGSVEESVTALLTLLRGRRLA
ncbi:hypothetical protein QR77_38985 [Streptomyces sp. 150FB]|uniref:adenylyl-sulfate kinase n=1 Tax=Streptomyces sp. 150FB TaxID=1576605 RepID=UPI000589410C|nr:adenylyl-sulfate kinase [Streptomyces sp. 150FB]KIF78166.1 hypothetical protein QR77_38985 [Streptomyces sp. 150FB]